MAVLVATTVAANAADGIRREAVRTWGDITSSARPAHPADARVIVVLRAKPAATRHDAVGSDAAATAAKTAQDRALAQIASAGVELAVQQRFTRTVNAVVATVRGDQRARLAADHAVLGVYPVRQLVPATVSESVATALGDAVRPVASGLSGSGAGVTIAVLDGPIDEGHAALAGRVDHPAAAPQGSSDATAEHGTAIASLAAGANGPAGLHGVAPGARVLAIRVLTPSGDGTLIGTTADLLAGLEQAADPNGDGDLADHARVAVAAVAAPFAGFDDAPEARAVAALDTLGTVVVAPAGNDGPTGGRFGTLASPGGAPDALTVGASDGRPALPQVDVTIGGGVISEHVGAVPLAGALAPPAGQLLPVRAIAGTARTTKDAGALASDYQGPDGASTVAGAAVLVPRDGGDLRAKVRQAAAQGAAEVLLYGADAVPAGALGGDDRVGIPVLSLDEAHGMKLAQAVAGGQAVTVTTGAAAYGANGLRDAVAPFSSEGLGWDDRLKPDVVLPGVAILGADAGGGYASVSGTSVAAAEAAGMVAVLAAEHPDWSAERLRSALISTAGLLRGLDAPLAPVQAQGGGRPDAGRASAVSIVTSPVSLSLGRPGKDRVAHGTLRVENLSNEARTLSLGLQRDAAGDAVGLSAAIDPARFVLAPHAVASLPVAVRVADPSAAVGVAGGWIAITQDGGPTQRVPLAVALPGPAAAPVRTATLTPAVLTGATATARLALALGAATAPGDGTVQLVAVRTLSLELYQGSRRVAVLYTARDLLPGRYGFTVRPLGPGGEALAAGRYRLVVRATGTDGETSRTSLRLRVG
jgi:subtilisin family serine protease